MWKPILPILVLYFSVCSTAASDRETNDDTVENLKNTLMLFQEKFSYFEDTLKRERELNLKFRQTILEENAKLRDRLLKLEKEFGQEKDKSKGLAKYRDDEEGSSNMNDFRNVNESFGVMDTYGRSKNYRGIDKDRSDVENSEGSLNNAKRLLLPTTSNPVANEAHVAFYAYMYSNEVNPGPHHILVFDVVKTNVGNHYHPTTGAFTTPTSGLYVFTWSIRQYGNDYHVTELIINNDIYGTQYLYAKSGYVDASVSQTLVADLKQGEDVFVRTHSTFSPKGSIRSDSNGRSTFAGWKIN